MYEMICDSMIHTRRKTKNIQFIEKITFCFHVGMSECNVTRHRAVLIRVNKDDYSMCLEMSSVCLDRL